ncbi:MAG: thioredoxin domain-containing protein [Oscillospiraceae bacterium]|nr:thioredoxin domain-containing protein [Oscillospiraceae bacterium]
MQNHLNNETSPYLLQHADNPVDWYPWGEEAFKKARKEDKPIFLSIGYSTCHWCHVMAHESFEDSEIAELLNRHFVSVKVDKEERPDIDSIYMAVCQAFTGSGGWPTSIFMTAEQKPFFAGTYFPKRTRGGMIGLRELLKSIHKMWTNERHKLLEQADEIIEHLEQENMAGNELTESDDLINSAVGLYQRVYDRVHGGFGSTPKFPTPHNLLFLLTCYERIGDDSCLKMAEHTLLQMYRGGLFDHIGFGFCRYSTDERFLVPHFEKMLYDNALLIMAYCKAYGVTGDMLYLEVAEKTAEYILREMTSHEGGFYCAQDADSNGEEGKYYLFSPEELKKLLGKLDGESFCRHFDITESGNFEGKNIPNLLKSNYRKNCSNEALQRVLQYRKERNFLHLDDKILTAWNSMMIAAMCTLYQSSGKHIYLDAARKADHFIQTKLCDENGLYVSYRDGKRGVKGFLDDYASYMFAQLALYSATLEENYLKRAEQLCRDVQDKFQDQQNGGFFLYGTENESLILRPKEDYDGAVPSGNSMMAWNLVRLYQLVGDDSYQSQAEKQLNFLGTKAKQYPIGHAMFLLSLMDYEMPPPKVTVVMGMQGNIDLQAVKLPIDTIVILLRKPTEEYPLKEGKTTFYVCKDHKCLPPVNDLSEIMKVLRGD